jgi:hypothetical protein
VQDFLKSPLVAQLQERLEKRAAEKSSWLSEWWNETGESSVAELVGSLRNAC